MADERLWSEFLDFVGRAPAARHPGLLFDGPNAAAAGHGVTIETVRLAAQRPT